MTDQERLDQFTTLIGKPPRKSKFNAQGQLIKLDLAGLELTALPPQIGQFQHLTHLYLGRYRDDDGTFLPLGNPLATLPAEVGRLQQLQQLDLSITKLRSLPAEVGQLQRLQQLDLYQTQLTSLPPEVGQLQHLQQLNLSRTLLRSLPAEVGQLQQLQRLYLRGTRLTSLPAEVGQLQQLQQLDLRSTRLTSLPAKVGQLQQLQQLDLRNTQLRSLPAEVGQLQQLQRLYLGNTHLTSLPAEIRQLKKLEWLDLRETKLPLPPEILEKTREPQTILDYYFQAHKPLNEAKLLLVGQGGVGKTSLVKRLVEGGFEPEEAKTEGINIRPWQMQVNGQEIRLNIWDFGGQEIMHATHQFFLTHRSLYLLVLDARQGEQEGRLEYWLKLIRSFGGDSPVIVVLNKCDQHHLALDQRGLEYKYYPNLKAFVETSCQSGVGLPELAEHIRQELAQMAHVGDLMPPTWLAVKSRLEAMQADYLPYHEYLAICQQEFIHLPEDQSRLIRLLHDLGIALNYPDARLEETSVLKPEWVTNGIYQIINSPHLAHCDGMLERSQLGRILDPQRYPASKQLFIIDMMRKFELCFAVEGGQDEQFLIPDLLPKEQPDFTWQHAANLAFEYHYDILPGSILSRFIVRMHIYVLPQKAWRSGVILADGDNQALIIADREEGKVYISVGGQERSRRAFLTVIRSQFEHIHRTITGIKAKQMIPLSGYRANRVDNQVDNEAIPYQDLLSYEKVGDLTPWWPSINARLNVKQLLDGVGRIEQEPPSQDPRRRHPTDSSQPREAWRENRWLREEEARKEEARKAEEERQREEKARKEEARKAEEERKRAEAERKQKRYQELALRRESVVRDAEGKAKRLMGLCLFCYSVFCVVFMLMLFAITNLLSDELFSRLVLLIDLAIAMIILPAVAWATSHYLKLDSLWPSDVHHQLREGEFNRLCGERHFPEPEYQELEDQFGNVVPRLQ